VWHLVNTNEKPTWYEDKELILISKSLGDRITGQDVIQQLIAVDHPKSVIDRWVCHVLFDDKSLTKCPVESFEQAEGVYTIRLCADPCEAMAIATKKTTHVRIMYDDASILDTDVKNVHSVSCNERAVTLSFS
jgi:hypothetical protein